MKIPRCEDKVLKYGKIRDIPMYWLKEDEWRGKVYEMWKNMWDRCNNTSRPSYKHYINSLIYDDFRYLSKFFEWIISQSRFEEFCSTCNKIIWTIDKDIIDPSNIHYFPQYMTLCTQSENGSDANNRRDYSKHKKPVKGINIYDGSIIIIDSMNEAKQKGFNPSYIRLCIKGERIDYKGYKWSYLDNFQILQTSDEPM